MEAQQVFDQVVTSLRKQGSKSVRHNQDCGTISCMYRSDDGKKCAAGHLILPEEYDPTMEGKAADCIIMHGKYSSKMQKRLKPHTRLIYRLQRIHDSSEVSEWERDFKILAEDFNLIYTPPSQ